MAGRWWGSRGLLLGVLLLGVAGCPQLQNDDWLVSDASTGKGSGDAANASDSAPGNQSDANARDGSPTVYSDDAAAHDGAPDMADGSSVDAGAANESGASDTSIPDGPAALQMLYCNRATPRGITLTDANVCWVEGVKPRSLFCAPAAGNGAPAHVDIPGDAALLQDAFDLLFDATYVYWSNGQNNQVVRRPRSGGAAEQYFSGGARVSYLSAGAGATLWATDFPDPSDPAFTTPGEVIVGPHGTSSIAMYSGETGAAGVAVYNGNVYWGTPSGLAFGLLAGDPTSVARIASPESPVSGLAIDAAGVAYFLAGHGSLYRYVTGTQSPVLAYHSPQAFGAGDVAVDDQNVYFSEPDLGCVVRIAR